MIGKIRPWLRKMAHADRGEPRILGMGSSLLSRLYYYNTLSSLNAESLILMTKVTPNL